MYRRRKTISNGQILLLILAFCLLAAAFKYHKDTSGNIATTVSYNDSFQELQRNYVSLDKESQAALDLIIQDNITSSMSPAEKIKSIHDYIILNCAYDYDNLINDTIPDDSYNARGVFLNHTAVCQGYASAFKAAMDALSIPCKLVFGSATNSNNITDGHVWNMVNIDDVWYQIDLTWDDPAPDTPGLIRYSYFLVPDSIMLQNHQWEQDSYPVCNSANDSFISLIGPVCKNGDEIKNCLRKEYQNKATSYPVIVPTPLFQNYKDIYPYKWELEKELGIKLPDSVSTETYGSYTIYTFLN